MKFSNYWHGWFSGQRPRAPAGHVLCGRPCVSRASRCGYRRLLVSSLTLRCPPRRLHVSSQLPAAACLLCCERRRAPGGRRWTSTRMAPCCTMRAAPCRMVIGRLVSTPVSTYTVQCLSTHLYVRIYNVLTDFNFCVLSVYVQWQQGQKYMSPNSSGIYSL